ncbi:MAG: type 2 isopentenyl-diphosphate Delta-isomerase [Enterococcus sp.]
MNRKDEHVSLAKAFHKNKVNDFDLIRPMHHSLPETAVNTVDLSTQLFQTHQSSPFFINAMTGGSEKTTVINQQLARIAKATNLMLATGSVSAALKDPSLSDSFTIVRKEFPQGFLLANVGAGTSLENAQRAVDLFEANALQIHLNAPQELVMPEGDRDFTNWLSLIETIVKTIDVPVVVKEVGFGMTRETIHQLLTVGVQTIDVSGNGGTSFTQIENARRKMRELSYLADFGQSTAISLLEANEVPLNYNKIASGGIRNAYDIFKCLLLGADSVGISGAILDFLLIHGEEKTIALIQQWQEELRLLYALVGQTKTTDLRQVPLTFTGSLLDWCQQRTIDVSTYSFR